MGDVPMTECESVRGTRLEDFLSRVTINPLDIRDCWIWRGGRDSAGYGKFVGERAHRVAYIMFNGFIPSGLVVRHACDTKLCVRPSHLLLGTHADNVRDAVERGLVRNGERGSSAKYTDAQVARARELRAWGLTYQQVADEMGLTFGTVREWLQGRTRVVPTRPSVSREPAPQFLVRGPR